MRKEIEIWAMVAEQDWRLLDMENGMSLSFDFASNILNDVGSITSSRTFTIKLPRTTNNDMIMDFVTVPEYESAKRYANIPCRIYVNGVDITGAAYLYILASGAGVYECCVVFGLMQHYKDWVDAGKKLNELADVGEYIDWSWKAAYIFTPGAGSTHDPTQAIWNGANNKMHYGVYNPGFIRDDIKVSYANVHPFVTVGEIWSRVRNQNGLEIIMPDDVKDDIGNLAMILTKTKGNQPQGMPAIDSNYGNQDENPYTFRKNVHTVDFGWNIPMSTVGDCWMNGSVLDGTSRGKLVYKGDGKRLSVSIQIAIKDESSFSYGGSSHCAGYILNDLGLLSYLDFKIRLLRGGIEYSLTPTFVAGNSQNWIVYNGTIVIPCEDANEGDVVAEAWIDNDTKMTNVLPGSFNQYWMLGRDAWDDLFSFAQPPVINITYYEGTVDYPNTNFYLVPNLPDIKQLDFLKFICNLYGLFPVVSNQNPDQIDLVPISVLEENKPNAYDWSNLLDDAERDTPRKTAFDIGLAKRNRIAWKADEKDSFVSEAFIESNGAVTEREKDMFVLPFAATERNTVPQYQLTLSEDGVNYDVEFNECEYRIMRVTQWYPTGKMTKLSFVNLSAEYIATVTYAAWRSYVLNPVVITERVRLKETDLAEIDMTRPVFLAKYGRHFAIKDIKWTVGNAYAECELLML